MLKALGRRAMRHGPLGGSRQWTLVWAALVAVRVLRWAVRTKPEIVYSGTLDAGQSLEISSREGEPTGLGGRATVD